MNPWQVARQLRYLLKAATWADGSTEKVLRDVVVTAGTSEAAWGELRPPYCLINVGAATVDDRNPNLLTQDFEMALGVRVDQDRTGERAVIGGSRLGGDQGISSGRGILEVEEVVMGAIARLLPSSGVTMTQRWASALAAGAIQGDLNVVQRSYVMSCPCPRERTYSTPQQLAKSGTTLSWKNPADRFDLYEVVVNRKSGSTPPSSATDATATAVYSGGLDTSVTDSTSGTWTYAIWGGYDETYDDRTETPSASDRYSEAGLSIPGTTLEVS